MTPEDLAHEILRLSDLPYMRLYKDTLRQAGVTMLALCEPERADSVTASRFYPEQEPPR